MSNKQLLTPVELAARLNVETSTILRWVKTGKIPALRVGARTIRFDQSLVEQTLQEQSSRIMAIHTFTPQL